ncbi:hypothetical protein [Streptomyces sp. NPDC048442]|uniref:hypothetical protein n=1 Tax=Streptomyces sp. NPDC048442 TaxID=3154823 RepID=UPI00342F1BFA
MKSLWGTVGTGEHVAEWRQLWVTAMSSPAAVAVSIIAARAPVTENAQAGQWWSTGRNAGANEQTDHEQQQN